MELTLPGLAETGRHTAKAGYYTGSSLRAKTLQSIYFMFPRSSECAMRTHSLAQRTPPSLATKLLSIRINKSWKPHKLFRAQCWDQNVGNIAHTVQYTCRFHFCFKSTSYQIKKYSNPSLVRQAMFQIARCLIATCGYKCVCWVVRQKKASMIMGCLLDSFDFRLLLLRSVFRQDVWLESTQETQNPNLAPLTILQRLDPSS